MLQLRTQAEFEAANGVKAPAGKRYFQHTRLHDVIGSYPFRSGLADAQLAEEKKSREAFLDFLLGVLVSCILSWLCCFAWCFASLRLKDAPCHTSQLLCCPNSAWMAAPARLAGMTDLLQCCDGEVLH